MGAQIQPQGHVQTWCVCAQRTAATGGVDAPRWKVMTGMDIEIESGVPLPCPTSWRRRGSPHHSGDDTYRTLAPVSSSGASVIRLLKGMSRPVIRRDGLAAGY